MSQVTVAQGSKHVPPRINRSKWRAILALLPTKMLRRSKTLA
jgi:hypothetical protein